MGIFRRKKGPEPIAKTSTCTEMTLRKYKVRVFNSTNSYLHTEDVQAFDAVEAIKTTRASIKRRVRFEPRFKAQATLPMRFVIAKF